VQVGDLVKAPYLVDHAGEAGIVINIRLMDRHAHDLVEVLFPNGAKRLLRCVLEVISESR